jgi:pimeloyl-ACP methyl ester carboxylesterase
MNNSNQQHKTLNCPLRGHWTSFRLVDEHGEGKPYAGLAYRLVDRQSQEYSGVLDAEGYAKVENFYCGPVLLDLSADYKGAVDPWYKEIQVRKAFKLPLTALQVAAEQSPSGPRRNGQTYKGLERAEKEKARFFKVEVRNFAKSTDYAHLPDCDLALSPRPSASLKAAINLTEATPGVALEPNQHHVLEVKALRAYSPLLSRDKNFCALNNYHLALMTVTAYGAFNVPREPGEKPIQPPYNNPGSIAYVLQTQLGQLIKPTLFNDASPYHLLCEEVPYSKRLEIVPYDPERYKEESGKGWDIPENVHFLNDKKTETQAFATHNDKVVLISIRGTQEHWDKVRDADAKQVPYAEGEGQAHRGFYEAFLAAKEFTNEYLEAFYTGEQTLIVCGHSLGGAIALLLAEWLRRLPSKPDVVLYTYGSPRAGDRTFSNAAKELTHHRIVNHNDPVPGVPFTWMDAEWKQLLLGSAMLVTPAAPPIWAITVLLGGLLNLRGDPYEHHGEQRHFMPRKVGAGSEAAILWQPGCASISERSCALHAADIDLEGDMPKRKSLIGQVLSAAEHSSHSGYSRSALTTLLRWHASVQEREGVLFSNDEATDIAVLVSRTQELLEDWKPATFNEFRMALRNRNDMRFYKKTPLELQALFNSGQTQIKQLRSEQVDALKRVQARLQAQAQHAINAQDVFGDLIEREDLPELVSAWRALGEIQEAEQLVQVSPSTENRSYA